LFDPNPLDIQTMALREPPNSKHTDRHETDYERWLKDHDDNYQPEGKPRYHPSDADETGEVDDETHDIPRAQEDTMTKSKSTTKINTAHSHADNIDIDDDGTVVRVSRYGSILFPSKHHAASVKSAPHLGTSASASTDNTHLRLGDRESMMCCGISMFFMVVFLMGLGWSIRKHRQRQQRGQATDGISRDRSEIEKVCSVTL
jgi:hypothetical protein